MKNYEKLEQKIQELQAEVERLKKEEQRTQLPEDFNRRFVLDVLNHKTNSNLGACFNWSDTPQGYDYWREVCSDAHKEQYLPDDAIVQLQEWVIRSYQQELGE